MSEYLIALILGLVEGLTEFIPVSSTGHLILFGNALSFTGPLADSFEVIIQLGAILAVVVLYFNRFLGLLDFSQRGASGFRGFAGLSKIAVASVPAFVLGGLLHKIIKSALFSPVPVAAALIIGGVVMIVVEGLNRAPDTNQVEQLTLSQAWKIGLFQCFALWPGMSRSASTIIGGLLVGVSRSTAAEFSFVLAVPVMFGATALDAWKNRELLMASNWQIIAIGFVVSFITAVGAIRFFMALLARFNLKPFGIYRILLGALVLLIHFFW